MIRITSIQLENFRAFFGLYNPIKLSQGENLLLYGENGSGKSSLFKALKHFLQSSRNTGFVFEENSHTNPPVHGSIQIKFSEFDATDMPVPGTDQLLTFSNTASSHRVLFIQNADLVKGFLDYRSLLRPYFQPDSNIFDLIVKDILREIIPIGETEPIGVELENLLHTLKTTDRRYNDHWDALSRLPLFESMLRRFLDRLFLQLNRLLIVYFKLNLRVWYTLQPLTFNHDYTIWNVTEDLRLTITLNGIHLINHTEYLNEARLSALSICLYLSALKRNPADFDCKILFLDDVFIGLDASNRIPILKILKTEFSNYQIFISSYDRHWYELAQRFFQKNSPGKWLFNNLYVGKQIISNGSFDKPILIQGDNDFNKAVFYLHHPDSPDYPAAANYFRKFAESILATHLPTEEIRNEDYSLIESYKLTALVSSALHFIDKIGAENDLVVRLDNALPTLLHPLSHFNLTSPIYKGELIDIQNCLLELVPYLIGLKDVYRKFLAQGRMIKLRFAINTNETGYYEIYTKETTYLVRSETGLVRLSAGECHCKTCYKMVNNSKVPGRNFNNNDSSANYVSIKNSYDTIYGIINQIPEFAHIPMAQEFASEFLIPSGDNWLPLDTLIAW